MEAGGVEGEGVRLANPLDRLQGDLDRLKAWIAANPHLPQSTDANTLSAFALAAKGDLRKAERKLENYLRARAEMPIFTRSREDLGDEAVRSMSLMVFNCVGGGPGGRCLFSSLPRDSVDDFSFSSFVRRALAQYQILLAGEPSSGGDTIAFDCTSFTVCHTARVGLLELRDCIYLAQECVPLRIKALVFFNAPTAIDFLVNKLIKPFLKKKLAKRIYVYREDHTVLTNHFPLKLLPKDYGGESPSMEELNDFWMDTILEKSSWLIAENNQKYRKPKSVKGKAGRVEEDFKRLEID